MVNKLKENKMKRNILIGAVIILAIILVAKLAGAVPAPKYFVCKYTGKPGVDEVLQTGNNPISVSANALTPPIVIGGYFNDAQGRSYVVAEDTGQDEPECPVVENEEPETPVEEEPKEEKTPVETPVIEQDNTPIVGK